MFYAMLTILILMSLNMVVCKSDGYPAMDDLKPSSSPEVQRKSVLNLVKRLISSKQKFIDVSIQPNFGSTSKDIVKVELLKDVLKITANNGVAASWGLNHYLKYHCNVHISWTGNQLKLPEKWPNVNFTKISKDRFKYYLNVCTESYTMVWWTWERWEKEIDWMALNGINLPLAFTGQEKIFQKTFKKFGLSESDTRDYFPGPAFLAWGRMGNLQRWGGPLSQTWIDKQFLLQKKIVARMFEFGMYPVFPGFSGHIPEKIQRLYPKAKITRLSAWGHFTQDNLTRTYFLDPTDRLFKNISKVFLDIMIKEFGSSHIYNIDLFNEMQPVSGSLDYLRETSKGVYDSLKEVDSKAIWLMQGWMFYSNSEFWNESRVESFVTAVQKGNMIILDLTADVYPQYNKYKSFYGQPFIWCMLNNYGGVDGMFGNMLKIKNGPITARNFPNSTIVGIGMAPEGINHNYPMYDLMNEMSWRDNTTNLDNWIIKYAHRRYGWKNRHSEEAWILLLRSVFNSPPKLRNHGKYVMVRRPSLKSKSLIWYDPNDLFQAWKALNQIIGQETYIAETFKYDLVNVARQSLQVIFSLVYKKQIAAYEKRNMTELNHFSATIEDILMDLDDILKTNKNFLLGKWINDSIAKATTDQERLLYNMNARTQITIWGPNGEVLDYAVKQWSGLVKDYLLPRWKFFSNTLIASARKHRHFPSKFFREEVFAKYEKPFSLGTKSYSAKTEGSTTELSKKLYEKYIPLMKSINDVLKLK